MNETEYGLAVPCPRCERLREKIDRVREWAETGISYGDSVGQHVLAILDQPEDKP